MPTKQSAAKSTPRGVVTVMFTDIVDSSRLKSAMAGDSTAARDGNYLSQIKGPHDALVRKSVQESGGHLANSTGDGYCCTFADAEAAVQCALHLQDALQESPISTPSGALKIRIGLHTGHAEPTGGEYASSTVDLASRVQSRATGGEILVTHETQVLVNRRLRGVKFLEAGSCELKGVGPQHLYRVIRASVEPAPEPVKIQNPYGFSGTASHGTFKGRETELDELVDSIESGTHTAIFGLQRMGKTSLIKEGLEERIQHSPELQRSVLLADIDLMKLGDDEVTYKDLCHAIIQSITTKLLDAGIGKRVEGLKTLTNELWATSRYERGDRTQFFATVSRVIAGLSDVAKRRIVLFIDEFSELRKVLERNKRALAGNPMRTKNIYPHEMFIDPPFVHHLSALLKDAKLAQKFTLVVAVRPFMAEYDAREGLQILKLMKPITLYYLEEPAAKALITEPLEGQIEYGQGVVDYLYDLTAGHPYLLQFILKNVVDRVKREKRREVNLEDIQAFEERMISQGPAYDAQFEVAISDYSVAEVIHPQEAEVGKGAMALIAKMGEDDPDAWVAEDEIFDKLSGQNIPLEKSASLLSQLVRTKILEEDSGGGEMRYRIAVPLLRKRFVRQNLYLKYFR